MDDRNKAPFTCQDVEERIDDAVDERLTTDEALALEAHISLCAPCELQLNRAKQVMRALLTTSPADDAAADNHSLLASKRALGHILRLQRSATLWHRRRFWFLGAAWIGALLLMIRALTGAGKTTIDRAETWLHNGVLGNAVAIVGISPAYWLVGFMLGLTALVLATLQMSRSRW